MTILTLKSLISILFLVLTCIAVFTMFEVFGRSEKRFNVEKLKKIHRLNGIVFLIVFLVLGVLGMTYIALTRAELSPRGTFHVMLAHGVLFLFLFKLAVIRCYRQFYGKVPTVGILIAFLALGTVASSTGYYILSGRLTSGTPQEMSTAPGGGMGAQTVNIREGKKLFSLKCSACHDVDSDSTSGAPGMKDILKRPALPSSGRPATADNIALQLKTPYKRMPAFPDLTEAEVNDLIAYMKGL